MIITFQPDYLRAEDHLEDKDVYEKIILNVS
jgi:hypothetical protein